MRSKLAWVLVPVLLWATATATATAAAADSPSGQSGWSISVPPEGGPTVWAVSCRAQLHCLAVGNTNTETVAPPYVASITGSATTTESVPLPAGSTTGRLRAVDCTGPFCVAVGDYQPPTGVYQPLLEVQKYGTWHATAVPRHNRRYGGAFNTVACNLDRCVAGGGGSSAALLQVLTAGTWSEPSEAGFSPSMEEVSHVACPPGHGYCAAIGKLSGFDGTNYYDLDWLLTQDATGWTATALPSWVGLISGLSCWAPGQCVALAAPNYNSSTPPPSDPVIVDFGGGGVTITPLTPPSGVTTAEPDGISCVAPGYCLGVGTALIDQENDERGLLIEGNAGVWSVTMPDLSAGFSNPAAGLFGVSCASPDLCTAVGFDDGNTFDQPPTEHPVAATLDHGVWSVQAIPLRHSDGAYPPVEADVVSCAGRRCLAAGSLGQDPTDDTSFLARSPLFGS